MPFAYAIVDDLAVVHGYGRMDFATWHEVMRQVVDDPRFTDGMPILLDASEVANAPQPGEGAMIAIRWRALAPKSRGAILTAGAAELAVAQQIEGITDQRLRAFTGREAALAWLRS